ncbi:hypothetical protein Tco_1225490 [Tanacetum coccineum]
MSTSAERAPTPDDFVVQNTKGKGSKQTTVGPMPDEKLYEFCDKPYNQLLSLMAEKPKCLLYAEARRTKLSPSKKLEHHRIHKTRARRDVSAGRADRDSDRRKREERNLVRSYVTCFSKRQREIEREWDATDRANRKKPTRDEECYLYESENDGGRHWKSKNPKSNTNEEDLSHP